MIDPDEPSTADEGPPTELMSSVDLPTEPVPAGDPATERMAEIDLPDLPATELMAAADLPDLPTTELPASSAVATELFHVGHALADEPLGRPEAAADPESPTDPESPAASGGLGATFAKHRTAWLVSALTVAFLIFGTGSVFAGVALAQAQAPATVAAAGPVASPSPSPTVDPARLVPDTIPAATRVRTCSIAAAAADPALGRFEGQVVNTETGEVLFDRAGSAPAATASGMKLLTASAALAVLGPTHQISTRVVQGSNPGQIVLVGGGDPTLSALPAGTESYYRGAPKLSDLAAQTLASLQSTIVDVPITEVVLDATLWSTSDKWDSSWQRSEQTNGYHSEVTALMVDGDRADPKAGTSPRSTDPVARAGAAFVAALGQLVPPTVSLGSAPAGAAVLGEVKSQPVSTLISQMLPASDNTLAEMLGRLVSKGSGNNGSAASLATVIPKALETYGLDTTGLVVRDGSGLSGHNAVPPSFMTQLMIKVHAGAGNLSIVYQSLPVSGTSGTLAGRFTGANAAAKGAVTAKTGFILTAYTLTGIIRSADGTALAFAFFAEDNVKNSAIQAIDTVTTAAFGCGDNLSNF